MAEQARRPSLPRPARPVAGDELPARRSGGGRRAETGRERSLAGAACRGQAQQPVSLRAHRHLRLGDMTDAGAAEGRLQVGDERGRVEAVLRVGVRDRRRRRAGALLHLAVPEHDLPAHHRLRQARARREDDLERSVAPCRGGGEAQLGPPERRDAAAVLGARGGFRAEVVGRPRPGVVEDGEPRPARRGQEAADPPDETGVVDREPPLRQRVRLAGMGTVERLVRGVRGDAATAREDVVADHVDERIAGIELLRRPAALGVEARDRVPDHRQPRRRIHGQLPAADGTQPEAPQLRVDLTAVEDQVRAAKRLLVRRRTVRGSLRAAVRPRRRVEVLRVVHLRHDADVDRAVERGDCLVERDQVGISPARGDLRGRDRLAAGATLVGADVDHRHRLQTGEELREGRAPGAPLAPAEEDLTHLRDLPGLALEAVRLAGDPEQRPVGHARTRRRHARCGEGEQEHEERERPHRLSIRRKSDGVQNV